MCGVIGGVCKHATGHSHILKEPPQSFFFNNSYANIAVCRIIADSKKTFFFFFCKGAIVTVAGVWCAVHVRSVCVHVAC